MLALSFKITLFSGIGITMLLASLSLWLWIYSLYYSVFIYIFAKWRLRLSISSHKIFSFMWPNQCIHSLNPDFRLSSWQYFAQWHSYFLPNVRNILTDTIYYFSCSSYSVHNTLMTHWRMFFSSETPEHFPLCCVQLMNSLISSLISLYVRGMHSGYETTSHFQHFS